MGSNKMVNLNSAPLPADLIPTLDDISDNEASARTLSQEYNIDFASFIGLLIYSVMTQCKISFAVKILAKTTSSPLRVHSGPVTF
jgi:hypothetical protein